MSTDQLADLLAEMEVALIKWYTPAELVDVPVTKQAEWLRANRDRVIKMLYADDRDAALKALGGREVAPCEDGHDEWWFPYE